MIANFLNISIEKDNKDIEERIIALVDFNLLIKKSSKGKNCVSLIPEMILDNCQTAENTTSTKSSSTDTTNNEEKEFRESQQ